MHAIIETRSYLAAADAAGMGEVERTNVASLVGSDPIVGQLMVGTGGCRKFRFRKPSTGKSGGYRIVSFYDGEDIPVVLLTVFGKGEKDNLTKAERNALARMVKDLAVELRKKGTQ